MCKQTWNKCDTVCDTELDNNPDPNNKLVYVGYGEGALAIINGTNYDIVASLIIQKTLLVVVTASALAAAL